MNKQFIIIAHRGLLNGPSNEENQPETIQTALNQGFHVEIDVSLIKNVPWLGHDTLTHKFDFPPNEKLWCHAKNLEALSWLLDHGYHCFWHQDDDYTLTSLNYIWTYPNKSGSNKSICVMPEKTDMNINQVKKEFIGVCTDYPYMFR